METAPSGKRKRVQSESPHSDLPSLIDGSDSSLSSAVSFASEQDTGGSDKCTRSPSKPRIPRSPAQLALAEVGRVEPEIAIENVTRIDAFRNDYATAAVSRPRRGCSLPVTFESVPIQDEEQPLDRVQSHSAPVEKEEPQINLHELPPDSPDGSATNKVHDDLPIGTQNITTDKIVENEEQEGEVAVTTNVQEDRPSKRRAPAPSRKKQKAKAKADSDAEYVDDTFGQSDAALASLLSAPKRVTRNEGKTSTTKKTSTAPSSKRQPAKPKASRASEKVHAARVSKPAAKKNPAQKSNSKSHILKFKFSKNQALLEELDKRVSSEGTPQQIPQEPQSKVTKKANGSSPAPIHTAAVAKHELYPIVQKLFPHRDADWKRPDPAGKPEVWADGRQEICETLHYYRAYQSACYSTGGFVRAFMFDKIAHARDYIDSDVVISRAGGGLLKDKESGEMLSNKDQSEDTSIIQGLRNCMSHYNPVVIINGNDNPKFPSKPLHVYCVLDYFKPTHIWSEKSNGNRVLRYRFEKLNTSKTSWWRPENEEDSIEVGSLDPPVTQSCSICEMPSLQVYLNGWMCLQPYCSVFWKMAKIVRKDRRPKFEEPDEASLVYDPRFLKQKVIWPNDDHTYPLTSSGPELSNYAIPGEDTSQAFWAGIVCPDCGRCISRLNWLGWECSNPNCSFKREPKHTLIPATSLQESFWPLTNSYTLSRDIQSLLIKVRTSFAHGYRIVRYQIPGLDGFITHMIANKAVVSEPGGPDTMFEELQKTDIGLRRRSMPNGQLKGDTYCRHFTVNYGMPYKFIAATASHSFSDAARPVTATRSRLNWAAKFLLKHEEGVDAKELEQSWPAKEFNEVLALGYFESQKINYHDDGEFGLGPTIATLSLGAPGTMRIRMKARHYNGVTSTLYDDSRPLPGCKKYEERLALAAELAELQNTDKVAYRARLKEIPKELGLKSGGNARDVLKMELGHGDIVVMHGAELQKYYEHAVEHSGKLRFALTCRYIDPGSLKDADKPTYTVEKDEGGYDGSTIM